MHEDHQPEQDIINHMKDEYGFEMTMEEVKQMPLYEKMWASWQALAYYKKSNYYRSKEDVPEGTEHYTIIEGNEIHNYSSLGSNKPHLANVWTIKICKMVYGTDIIG